MIEREHLIEVARSWVGTPYVFGAEVKGAGADCAGFLKAVLIEAGFLDRFETRHYEPHQWLHRNFSDTTYLSYVRSIPATEIERDQVLPGDLVLYRFVRSWTHGALVIDWPTNVIHCMKDVGVSSTHGEWGFLANRNPRFFRLDRWMVTT